MSETKHTQTPWEQRADVIWSPDGKGTVCAVSQPRATQYVEFVEVGLGCEGWDEAMANARFIVRACNSHQALLDALERINMFACYASEENTDARAEMLLQIGLTAREAIAKAEGKE